jgi:hypothetical protein
VKRSYAITKVIADLHAQKNLMGSIHTMMSLLGYISRNVKHSLVALNNLTNNFKWLFFSPLLKSSDYFSIHFLVVKDPKYVEVLKICINSFLYWHPKSQITIHVDDLTRQKVLTDILNSRNEGKIKVISDMQYPSLTWQELKIKLITSLNGTSDIYLDADMRWNGRLKVCDSITFLISEFQLKNRTSFLLLVKTLREGKYIEAYMRNTSFFTFGGNLITHEQIENIERLHLEIIDIFNSDMFGLDDKPHLVRISEQLALCIASQDWKSKIEDLKESDNYKDGTFLESSYFGSTGTTF